MLIEYSTGALIGTAVRSYIKHAKAKESYRISVASAEKVAKAELEIEKHQQAAEQELDKLICQRHSISLRSSRRSSPNLQFKSYANLKS